MYRNHCLAFAFCINFPLEVNVETSSVGESEQFFPIFCRLIVCLSNSPHSLTFQIGSICRADRLLVWLPHGRGRLSAHSFLLFSSCPLFYPHLFSCHVDLFWTPLKDAVENVELSRFRLLLCMKFSGGDRQMLEMLLSNCGVLPFPFWFIIIVWNIAVLSTAVLRSNYPFLQSQGATVLGTRNPPDLQNRQSLYVKHCCRSLCSQLCFPVPFLHVCVRQKEK